MFNQKSVRNLSSSHHRGLILFCLHFEMIFYRGISQKGLPLPLEKVRGCGLDAGVCVEELEKIGCPL